MCGDPLEGIAHSRRHRVARVVSRTSPISGGGQGRGSQQRGLSTMRRCAQVPRAQRHEITADASIGSPPSHAAADPRNAGVDAPHSGRPYAAPDRRSDRALQPLCRPLAHPNDEASLRIGPATDPADGLIGAARRRTISRTRIRTLVMPKVGRMIVSRKCRGIET